MPRIACGNGGARGHRRRVTFWQWLLLLPVAVALAGGCCRSTGPVKHEVHKPVSPDSIEPPPVVSYPNIPQVPEKLRNPSPPIHKNSAVSKRGSSS
jgi:hypothetical protein